MHIHLKGLVNFNLLFLFYSQQEKDSLNMSNFFYHQIFQPQENNSVIFKDKKKKKINATFIIKYFSSHCQQNNKNVCIYRENNDIISFCRPGFSFCLLLFFVFFLFSFCLALVHDSSKQLQLNSLQFPGMDTL